VNWCRRIRAICTKSSSIVALTAVALNFDEFTSGGQHHKYAVATCNLGIISAIS
jgi:hypothetical protein